MFSDTVGNETRAIEIDVLARGSVLMDRSATARGLIVSESVVVTGYDDSVAVARQILSEEPWLVLVGGGPKTRKGGVTNGQGVSTAIVAYLSNYYGVNYNYFGL